MEKYHVYFCTAGSEQYAKEVMKAVQSHLLSEPNVAAHEANWITANITERYADASPQDI